MKTALLVGSSIFEAWNTAPEIFPNWKTVNRAIGGTVTSYWAEQLANTLSEENPDIVLYYCGSNDVGTDVPQNEILRNVLRCRESISEHSPAIRFAYFAIIKAPEKAGKWTLIDTLNAQIQAQLPADDLFVDTNAVFFDGTKPRDELFIEDGLHLRAEAYARLSVYAAPLLHHWLRPVDSPG